MTRAWKPGDVALIKFSSGDHRAIRDVDGSWLVVGKASSPGYAVDRPLVVIDPEDRGQVERLWRAWRDLAPDHSLAQDNLQAALREFANPTPPKPEEPTGLGAVVEDSDGARWVKWSLGHRDERDWKHHTRSGEYRRYANITAVRVLSDGVQP